MNSGRTLDSNPVKKMLKKSEKILENPEKNFGRNLRSQERPLEKSNSEKKKCWQTARQNPGEDKAKNSKYRGETLEKSLNNPGIFLDDPTQCLLQKSNKICKPSATQTDTLKNNTLPCKILGSPPQNMEMLHVYELSHVRLNKKVIFKKIRRRDNFVRCNPKQ